MPAPQTTPKARPKRNKDAYRNKVATAAAFHELEIQVIAETARLPIAAEAPTAVVSEPPIDRDPMKLDPAFREKLLRTLEILKARGSRSNFMRASAPCSASSGCTGRDARPRSRSAAPARS